MKSQVKPRQPRRPLVSVVCISYNQEKYIAQAIDSFLMQRHEEFDVEILIADDASTDNTPQIIKQYSNNNKQIKAILRAENIGIQNNLNDIMRQARGEYIALCEGDDYWIDDTKLQHQVGFLSVHKDYSVCFHPVKVVGGRRSKGDAVFPGATKGFTLRKLLEENYIQTNSVMYRRQNYDVLPDDILPLDWYYHLYHAQFGKIGFINKVMAAYRRHENGVWQRNSDNENDFWAKRGAPHLRMHERVLELFKDKPEYAEIAGVAAVKTARIIFKAFGAHGDTTRAGDLMSEFPKLSARLLCEDQMELDKQKRQLDEINGKLYQQGIDVQHMQATIEELRASNQRLYRVLKRTVEYWLVRSVRWVTGNIRKKK